jgi:hypothetical protein
MEYVILEWSQVEDYSYAYYLRNDILIKMTVYYENDSLEWQFINENDSLLWSSIFFYQFSL